MIEQKHLNELYQNLHYKGFAHLYIEKRALCYDLTHDLIKRFPNSKKVIISHYKDVFNRPKQSFMAQKKAQKLIIAVKEEAFLYDGPSICENFGYDRFFYASTLLNCIYNCDYCYLQGMYQSANMVVFVNIEDFFKEIDNELKNGPMYLCASYDTDLLAFEGVIPMASKWIQFASRHNDLLMEIRTKSANYKKIRNLKPNPSVILAWSLNPGGIVNKYEKNTPSLEARLKSVQGAINDGWKVRLSIEPVLPVDEWRVKYFGLIEDISKYIDINGIYDINIGVFRIGRDYYKKIKKWKFDTDLFTYPVICHDNVIYSENEDKIKYELYNKLAKHIPGDKIFI